MNKTKVILVGPGKGGTGKTAFATNCLPWFKQKGFSPKLYDFDWENTDKSGLQNFYPETLKLDIHSVRTLDEFFEAGEDPKIPIIFADLPAGGGEELFQWFDEVYPEASSLGMEFVLAAVTTNEAGSVQSTLKWAARLQERVDYLVVLNELAEKNSKFDYWHSEPKTKEFAKLLNTTCIRMLNIPLDLESEIRNCMVTLDMVARREKVSGFLAMTKNKIRATVAQRALCEELDRVESLFIPTTVS